MLRNSILVFLGGGIGAVARYWFSGAVHRVLPADFPYGTMAVNVVGCFLIGIMMALFDGRTTMSPSARVFITIGVLGGFTTFSTFSFETVSLFRNGEVARACANAFVTMTLCLAGTAAAWMAVKVITGGRA
jgi:CrcB protein